jgi:NADH dehydrogenase/NADH:ubiquinone oxidoreductase subunit G
VLVLLKIFASKYSFIKLRLTDKNLSISDSEETFVSNKSQLINDFESSSMCLLIGINTRYESPFLNLKLRKRYLKGNFKVFSLNSNLNLTFPTLNLGNNIKQLNAILEGTHNLCQTLSTTKNPSVLISSELLKRKDSYSLIEVLVNLKKYNKSIKINVINTSLNSSGVNYVDTFKPISKTDFSKSLGVYLLNINKLSSSLKIILELKLLNYYNKEYFTPKLFIKQNNGFNLDKKLFNSNTYINLPNNIFFSST